MMYYEDLHINPMDLHDNPFSLRTEIRQTISLITSVCVGLPALVWAFRLLHLQRKIRGRISVFVLLLLISSLIQLPLNLYSVKQIRKSHLNPELLQFWSLLCLCGFHLHQLVVLEVILSRIFSHSCCIITFILVFIFSIPIIFMDLFGNVFIFIIFCICTCLASLGVFTVVVCVVRYDCSTPVSKKKCLVFIVAFINLMLFLAVLIPVDFFRNIARPDWTFMPPHFMGLRAMLDPLLCVLVCRGNLNDAQTPQTHTEPNADQTSV